MGGTWTTDTDGTTTTVMHSSGWGISHTDGARLAEIVSPAGELLDAVQVVEWDWAPAEGGPSRASGVAGVEDLRAALGEYVAAHSEGLGLPGL